MKKEIVTNRSRLASLYHVLELDRAFIIFSIIYFPVAVLFLNNGIEAEIALFLFTLILGLLGILLIANFLLFLGRSANNHRDNYGSVLAMYVLNLLAPLLMFKIFAYVILRLLPKTHEGFMCEVKDFVIDIYNILQIQNSLNLIILLSMVTVGWFAMKAVGKQTNS